MVHSILQRQGMHSVGPLGLSSFNSHIDIHIYNLYLYIYTYTHVENASPPFFSVFLNILLGEKTPQDFPKKKEGG